MASIKSEKKDVIGKFWEENYRIIKDTKNSVRPTQEEVYSEFIQKTGLTDVDLSTFKVKAQFSYVRSFLSVVLSSIL